MGTQLTIVPKPVSIDELLASLDAEQRQVVLHDKGPLAVSASPGSGKTTACIGRLIYLVLARNVDPARILCVTFTRKGASEMTTRAARKIGEGRAEVRTFHALCSRILARDWSAWKSWQLDKKDRYKQLVKDACGHEHLDWKQCNPKSVYAFIEIAKAEGARPGSDRAKALQQNLHADERVLEAYQIAEDLRAKAALIQYSDWLIECVELFDRDEDARRRWANMFDFIMVDECQDNSAIQEKLIQQLGRDHRNVVAIGDEKQSVYAFRGARPDLFRAFSATWNAPQVVLHNNYRSSRAVIDLANAVLASDDPMVGIRETVGAVRVRRFDTRTQEAEAVVADMRTRYEDGARWNDMVVLYRTNALSRAIEEALLKRSVPYYVAGGAPFYERSEVKDLLAYVRIVGKRGQHEDVRRSLRTPFRWLGKAFLDRVQIETELARLKPAEDGSAVTWGDIVTRAAMQTGVNKRQQNASLEWARLIGDLRMCADAEGSIAPADLIKSVVQQTKYLEWKRKEEGPDSIDEDHALNLRELVNVASMFSSIDALLDHVVLQTAASKRALDADHLPDRVTLMSCHRSKALEWPFVFVITCNDLVMPHVHARDIDEERRVFYVAVSRARETLELSYVRFGMDASKELRPSPFIPRELLPVVEGESPQALPVPEVRTRGLVIPMVPRPIGKACGACTLPCPAGQSFCRSCSHAIECHGASLEAAVSIDCDGLCGRSPNAFR